VVTKGLGMNVAEHRVRRRRQIPCWLDLTLPLMERIQRNAYETKNIKKNLEKRWSQRV